MAKVSKEFKYDLEHQLAIFNVPEWLPGEMFLMITDQAAPNILPYYAISNYGRIWHIYERKFMSTSWDGPGYRIAVLRFKDGMAHTCRVHRLLMMTFRYIEGCENMMINHINGRKTSNYIDFPGIPNPDNLEWCNGSYNEKEAFRLGLKKPVMGEAHGNSTINDEIAHEVCRLLEEGNLTNRQIAEVAGCKLHHVENIRYRGAWKHISCNYNF